MKNITTNISTASLENQENILEVIYNFFQNSDLKSFLKSYFYT